MISHEHKCIFIHIPKTAGSSVNRYLGNNNFLDWKKPNYEVLYGWCPIRKIHLQHATPSQLLETELISIEQWKSYYKFTFVRNPWDRAYSDYLWMMKDRKVKGSFKQYITKSGAFKKVLGDRSDKFYRGDHLLPQQTYLIKTPGKSDFDFVGRFEDFDEDIAAINRALGNERPFDIHEKRNTNKLKHYSLFYNLKRKKLVEKFYAEDIEKLNYTFVDKKTGLSKLKNFIR